MTHDELVLRAVKWLKGTAGCSFVCGDLVTSNSETPDAIGFKSGYSCLIECKTTRSDFLSDAKKWFRRKSEKGMGDWRYYMAPAGIVGANDLPEGWGLIEVDENICRVTVNTGIKSNTWQGEPPFKGNKISEQRMLLSAMRRHRISKCLSPKLEAATAR